jgi:cytochrome P450
LLYFVLRQAVLKEALRIHPGVAFPLERHVPPEGAVICDTEIPGGTRIGINPAVIHMDRRVYGDDADQFRPERWLEASPEQLKLMDRSFLTVSLDFPFSPSLLSGKTEDM